MAIANFDLFNSPSIQCGSVSYNKDGFMGTVGAQYINVHRSSVSFTPNRVDTPASWALEEWMHLILSTLAALKFNTPPKGFVSQTLGQGGLLTNVIKESAVA